MEILTREECQKLYKDGKLNREQYEEEWQKGEIYRRFYKACPAILANFWIWAKNEGYDIYLGTFKKAWDKYVLTEDYLPAQFVRENLIGDDEKTQIRQKAFNDYCKVYIEEVRKGKEINANKR